MRKILADETAVATLREVYRNEVLPGFRAKGMGAEAEAYITTTLDRFGNPFLDHQLRDIAVNHREKVAKRIFAFLAWAGLPLPSSAPRLWSVCERNGIRLDATA